MRWLLIAIGLAGCGGHSGNKMSGSPPLTEDEIARACEIGYACLAPPIDGPTLPSCLEHLADLQHIMTIYRPEQIQCLVAAGANCVAARACVGYAVGPCSPDGDHCDGDRLVACSRGIGLAFDCRGNLGTSDATTCVAAANPTCGTTTCTSGTPDRCDGTRALHCSDGVVQEFDCGQIGMACVHDGDATGCAGTGAACTASRCDGSRLIRCAGGHEQVYDCAAMLDGGTCVPGGGNVECGFGPDCGTTATCNGTTAELCVLGAHVSIDCIAAGFTSCVLGSCLPASLP